jgi:hypothetical protein
MKYPNYVLENCTEEEWYETILRLHPGAFFQEDPADGTYAGTICAMVRDANLMHSLGYLGVYFHEGLHDIYSSPTLGQAFKLKGRAWYTLDENGN